MVRYLLAVVALLFIYTLAAQKPLAKFTPNDTLNPFYSTITYRLACNYAIKKQTDSCMLFIDFYLNHIERKTGITAILSSPEINANMKSEAWVRMRDSMIKELETDSIAKLNIPLFLQLLQYESEDQNARWTGISSVKKGKYKADFIDTLNLKHLKFIDSLLAQRVELSKVTVGQAGMHAIFLFIQHCQDRERQERYATQILNWVNSNDIKKEDYAIYIDRIRVRQNKAQVYGSQYWVDKENNKLVLYPVENISELNKNRKLIGLQSIQLYLLSIEFLEGKKFRIESVAGILKEGDNLQDYISKEIYIK